MTRNDVADLMTEVLILAPAGPGCCSTGVRVEAAGLNRPDGLAATVAGRYLRNRLRRSVSLPMPP
ncbi:MAG TPA: hypothetical protein VIW24_00405 [Aldersonia sp.]